MARIDLKNHMIDAGLFCVVYAAAFAVALLFGLGKIHYGDAIPYPIVFGILEIVKIFFVRKRFWVPLFFANVYLALCVIGLAVDIRHFTAASARYAFLGQFWLYPYLLLLEAVLSLPGYALLLVRHLTGARKTKRGKND